MKTIPGTGDDYSRCDYDELCSEAREAIDAVVALLTVSATHGSSSEVV